MSDARSLVALAELAQGQQPYTDAEDTSVVEGAWAITNNQTCEWALKRAANLMLEKQEIEAAVEAAKARLDQRAAALTAKLDRGIGFFESNIAKYATENREAILGGGKKRSRTYLYGIVGWRKSAARLVVQDEHILLDWAMDGGKVGLYRLKMEPNMAAIQELYKADGIIPPGTEVKPESEKLYIDPVDPAGPLKKGTP
jgi:phage host-nuclease inhibitor protein Gam